MGSGKGQGYCRFQGRLRAPPRLIAAELLMLSGGWVPKEPVELGPSGLDRRVPSVQCPVFGIHDVDDSVVPFGPDDLALGHFVLLAGEDRNGALGPDDAPPVSFTGFLEVRGPAFPDVPGPLAEPLRVGGVRPVVVSPRWGGACDCLGVFWKVIVQVLDQSQPAVDVVEDQDGAEGCVVPSLGLDDDVIHAQAQVGQVDASLVGEVGPQGLRQLVSGLPRGPGLSGEPGVVYPDDYSGGGELVLLPGLPGVRVLQVVVVVDVPPSGRPSLSLPFLVSLHGYGYGDGCLGSVAAVSGLPAGPDGFLVPGVDRCCLAEHGVGPGPGLGQGSGPHVGLLVLPAPVPLLDPVGLSEVAVDGSWVGLLDGLGDGDLSKRGRVGVPGVCWEDGDVLFSRAPEAVLDLGGVVGGTERRPAEVVRDVAVGVPEGYFEPVGPFAVPGRDHRVLFGVFEL